MLGIQDTLENVNVPLKANVYFEGKVISHTLLLPDGGKKSLGVIYPGSFTLDTDAAERMDILAGNCRMRLKGQADWKTYGPGSFFEVPAKSAFDITVEGSLVEYLCSFEN